MTATMSMPLLSLFQKVSGITVDPLNYVWENPSSLSRRHISINMQITPSKIQHLTQQNIRDILRDNLKKKIILYTNTAKKAEQIKDNIDAFLDAEPSIKGDTLHIYGEMYSNVKFVSSVKFTSFTADPEDMIKKNELFPRILIATVTCIGSGLDCNCVY